MFITMMGAALGSLFGYFRATQSGDDMASRGINIITVCLWTAVGTGIGFALGVGLLSSGNHPIQQMLK